MQQKWHDMSKTKKVVERILCDDYDKDGVPDKFDCRPKDPKKHNTFTMYNRWNSDEQWSGDN